MRARALSLRIPTRRVQTMAAAAGYLAFAAYLTWPLVIDLDSRLYGAVGDLTGAMSLYREYVDSGQFPFVPGSLTDLNAPDGLPVQWTLNIASWPSVLSLYTLTAALGEIPAFGVYTLLGFVLSGVAMFLFVRRYLGHAGVAFVAGWAYAFYPFPVFKAQGHVDFVHGWVLVIVLWRLVELLQHPSRRNGVLAGLALLLAVSWTPYHVLFGAILAAAFGLVALAMASRRRRLGATAVSLALAGAIPMAWLVGVLALDASAATSAIRTHTLAEAYAWSARWQEYLVPTPMHPIVGGWADHYRATHLHGSNAAENTLYVGVSVLALALVGVAAGLRRASAHRHLTIAAVCTALLALACSAPPKVTPLGITIPMPTLALFEITSTWRVFSRMVVVVMLALVVLAALGLLAGVRRRPPAIAAVLVAVALVVAAGDLWSRPPLGTNDVIVPEVYRRLASLPPGIAVEYPLLPAESSNYGDIFYQSWHHKPLLNGYAPGSPEESRALRLARLDQPHTVRGLSALGVRYVLLRRDIEASGLPDPGRPGPGLDYVLGDSYIGVYRVNVPGRHVLASPGRGFFALEDGPEGPFQWLIEREGTIEVRGSCAPCRGTLRFRVTSYGRPRTVVVRDETGRALVRRRLSRGTVRVPLRFSGRTRLAVQASPGPQAVVGPDPRSVSVAVGEAQFIAAQRSRP